jgi:hypothetical protein
MTTLGAYVLGTDPVAVGVAVAAVCGGLAAVLTAIGALVVAISTNRNVRSVVDQTATVITKQDTAAVQTAEIHAATNGNLAELQRLNTRLEAQLAASVATVADRDLTIAKAGEAAKPPIGGASAHD